jgi:hypothetical protein
MTLQTEYAIDHATESAAGYVVVARCSNRLTGMIYEAFDRLNDAADAYADYQNGEYRDVTPIGIFPCDSRGMPTGAPLTPAKLMQLVHETRSGA